jgi:hypothetical protein
MPNFLPRRPTNVLAVRQWRMVNPIATQFQVLIGDREPDCPPGLRAGTGSAAMTSQQQRRIDSLTKQVNETERLSPLTPNRDQHHKSELEAVQLRRRIATLEARLASLKSISVR